MGRKALQGEREVLAAALDNREFCVWYQPQVDMETGKIVGAEALVRWQRPGKGLILPGRFIPALEENGLMPLLDCEVLRIVCRDIREAREGGDRPRLGVSQPVPVPRRALQRGNGGPASV